MEIVLVGCGKVGAALVRRLSEEGHNITVIDSNESRIQEIVEKYDVLGVVGNGSSISALSEANLETADVLIAVTGSDELNLLCCMFAKKAGHCHAIARVRSPHYVNEIDFIKQQLDISTVINPELATAREITSLLRFPGAQNIETFAGGRVQLIKFELEEDKVLCNIPLRDLPAHLNCDILICAVERGGDVIIPRGDFTFRKGDIVSVVATPEKAMDFFSKLGLPTRQVRNTMIIGGGTIGYYLAKKLSELGIAVKVFERSPERAAWLAENLDKAMIIRGDGTDRKLLLAEGLAQTESFVSLTNVDEENILLGMFAKKHSKGKVATKLNRLEFDDIMDGLNMDSVVYPKYITADYILQYVRALQNAAGSNIKTLYRILDNRVEALEFAVQEASPLTDVPLYKLRLKSNVLVCCITRGDQVIIPRGGDTIQVGDSVIIVTLEKGLRDIRDILVR